MDFYSVLGNKTRIQLLKCLGKDKKTVSELILNCGLSQSAVSQHLSKLKEVNLVATERVGKTILYYSKNPKTEDLSNKLIDLESEINNATSIL